MSARRMTAGDVPATSTLEESVAEAIQACDGDLRATVRALVVANAFLERELVVANAFLERELERARALVSRGYVRGNGRGPIAPE